MAIITKSDGKLILGAGNALITAGGGAPGLNWGYGEYDGNTDIATLHVYTDVPVTPGLLPVVRVEDRLNPGVWDVITPRVDSSNLDGSNIVLKFDWLYTGILGTNRYMEDFDMELTLNGSVLVLDENTWTTFITH